ncbi:L,D-transpeptidase-like protein [Paenibacillus cellulosilyticus]|uniref:L,D-transpeptidase-like protein n=1 Tax=Paenibacillus cellulosilyticus TaxID=375489 RepID=A0A2V2YQY0_9BACL|nr:L,D-transpeptidase [Paenibacillus cellulosilyticus]PWV99640.1 L,D-transpeptidase-like protein [Paenibacillus cellulosilyticus]QKS44919.1 L,D-transpeptidase [Paenibacillus cellulosilyticus]
MEPIRNSEHLKEYVKLHPDNRMAWYLLGKQYEQQGRAAKANYCFIQAGDIYEAYEQKPDPLSEAQEQVRAQAEHAMEWLRKERLRRIRWRGIYVLAAILLLIAVFSFSRSKTNNVAAPAAGPYSGNAVGVELVEATTADEIGTAMQRLMVGDDRAALGIAARLQQDGEWRNWNGTTELLFAVEQQSQGGVMQLSWYESRLCSCSPADASKSYAAYGQWAQEQEQRWTLASGIRYYYTRTGQWPTSVDDLAQSYPNNYIAGDTPLMQAMFESLLSDLKDKSKGQSVESGAVGTKEEKDAQMAASVGNGKAGAGQKDDATQEAAAAWMYEPLQIRVDKKTHRLAVISGDIIIRSYKVGLGGDRTPEGSFLISEKVKNPNGRDDGPYGSRGMTLSDTKYAIHGTDEPQSIGVDDSLGCIRMSQEDLEELYDLVPLGTKVTIQQGGLSATVSVPAERFRLEPKQDETNPRRTYAWLN